MIFTGCARKLKTRWLNEMENIDNNLFGNIEREIRLLKLNKASQYSDIPTKIIKKNSDIFSNFICESINNFIKSSIFPSCLKHADVTPLHKRCNKSLKENYRP